MSVADRLRTDPVFKAMFDDAKRLMKAWPGTHVVAHRDEATGAVTFWLRVPEAGLPRLRQVLGGVDIDAMTNGAAAAYRFHGRRPDMDRLLAGLGAR
jgi:hypothetical protein